MGSFGVGWGGGRVEGVGGLGVGGVGVGWVSVGGEMEGGCGAAIGAKSIAHAGDGDGVWVGRMLN